ncbi:MAG: hypothetical protein ACLFS9_06640 [Nitriliruptoraceae bacterium]
MSARCPLPARASFRDLLRDLVGQSVTVRPGSPLTLTPDRPSYLAGYRFDAGEAAAMAVADLTLAAAAGAAIGMMPPQETLAEVEESGGLEGDLLEFFHEVVNVAARLLNSPSTPHVALKSLDPVPGEVAEDLAEMATTPSVRHDWTVTIEGYGEGKLALLG